MSRLSPQLIRKIEAMVDRLFDDLKGRYLGPRMFDKKLVIGYMRDFSLPGIYEQALVTEGGIPDHELFDSILKTAGNYIESQRAQAKAAVVRAVITLITRRSTFEGPSEETLVIQLNKELGEQWAKVTHGVKRIVDTENSQARGVGLLSGIVSANAAQNITDPTVIFIPVKADKLCGECRRLHLMPDGLTPRAWYLSEVSHQYHVRGEEAPSIGGLHPHCRCTMSTVMPGFGFGADGRVRWKTLGYDVLKDQRGELTKSEVEYTKHDCNEHRHDD